MQRFFSTFPGGWPGVGLLILRLLVGLAFVTQGSLYFHSDAPRNLPTLALSLAGLLIGAFLAAGFLTPLAASVAGIFDFMLFARWLQLPSGSLFDGRMAAAEIAIVAVAIALLGPGAFSVDSRLFGRREIVISPASRMSKL